MPSPTPGILSVPAALEVFAWQYLFDADFVNTAL
jgi:hypothetical protein